MRSSILIYPQEITKKWIDKMADGGVDVLGIHPVGDMEELLTKMEGAEFRELLDYAISKGMQIEYCFHALSYVLPRKLFESNPEYFRINEKGERSKDFNMCPSNLDALEIITEKAYELAGRLYGNNEKFHFWIDDDDGGFCKCERCSKMTASDQQMVMLGAMIKGVKRRYPDAKLSYLAFQAAIEPPSMKFDTDGIYLEYAPVNRWFPDEPHRFGIISREQASKKPLLDYFGNKDATVLEYWLDNSLLSRWKKPPKPYKCDGERLKKEVKEYLELGYRDVSTFGCFLDEDYEKLYGEADISAFFEAIADAKKDSY